MQNRLRRFILAYGVQIIDLWIRVENNKKKFEIPTLLSCGKSKNVDSQTRCGLGKIK